MTHRRGRRAPGAIPPRRGLAGLPVALVLVLVSASTAAPPVETELKVLGTLPVRDVTTTVVSPDGQHLAYVLRRGPKSAVFTDGKEIGEYDAVRHLDFSPKGRHLGYAASRDNVWFVVIDGKESEKYTTLAGPVFSPNEKHVAFVVGLGGNRTFLVCDGVPQMRYTALTTEPPVFSPDSRHVAYEARTSGTSKRPSIRDPNRPVTPNETPPDWVTPDGTEVDVHEDHVPRTHFIVRDAKKGPRTNDIHSPVFSPNSRTLVYAARFSTKWFIVHEDRKIGKVYDEVGTPVFSLDGRNLAYPAKADGKWSVVRGRKQEDLSFDAVRAVRFSPDGRLLAFAGGTGAKWRVVCEGRKGPEYDDIGWVDFSADGRHLAYTARRGHNRWMMVVDGVEGLTHASVLVPAQATELAEKLRYVTVDAEARLVEITWPENTDWSNGLK